MNDAEPRYGLLMPFLDESESFCNGFDCGRIWADMSRKQNIINAVFRNETRKQIEMMCRRFLYSYEIKEDYCDGWFRINAKPEIHKQN